MSDAQQGRATISWVARSLTVFVPAYNELDNLAPTIDIIMRALSVSVEDYEVIIVDDGSTDDTPRLLAEGMKRYPWLRVLRMAKNGGQSAAFEAGFEAARGEILATIDADLQNDPEEIPRLLPRLDGAAGQPPALASGGVR